MKRHLTLILTGLCGVILDCAVFAEWNYHGVRPWILLATALAACVSLNAQSAILTALAGGLMIDALSNSYLGLTAACYLISVSALWLIIRRNHPKLVILWAYAAFAAALWCPIEWLYSYLAGAHFGALRTILTRMLPSAVLTGACVLPIVKLFEWAKKGHRDRI